MEVFFISIDLSVRCNMNALRINGYVDKDGLKIGIDELKIFKNKSVEIIILSKDGSYSDIIKSEFEIENDFILQLINNPVSIESSVSFLSRDDANAR